MCYIIFSCTSKHGLVQGEIIIYIYAHTVSNSCGVSFEHIEASDARLRYRLHYVLQPFNSTIPVFVDGKGLHLWHFEASLPGLLVV